VSEQSTKPTKAERQAARRAQKDAVQAQELAAVRESDREAAKQQQELIKRERGRPSSYTPEQADSICAWIAQGRSAKSWCRHTGKDMLTVYRWMREHGDFRTRYARAHEDRADSLADELVDIADEAAQGTMEEIAAAKLRIDTRKWIASKLRPGRWGEQQTDTAKTAVTFNIGISRLPAHTVGHTIEGNPLPALTSTPGK